ncbi:MAG: phosphorylase [Saprospiraceae bacterium]
MNELDALHNIDLETRDIKPNHTRLRLVRMGTTGGLQAHTTAGSLVASTAGLGLDGLLHFYKAENQQNHPAIQSLKEQLPEWHFPVSPYFAEGDTHLVQRMVEEGYIAGITATNPGFYGPQGRQLRAPVQRTDYLDLLAKFWFDGMQIVNLEMETAAIYGLSQLLGHEALSLSVVLANRADGSFSTHPREDVQKLIEKSLDLIIEP